MPGLSGRFSTVVKAKVSKLLDKAEDPAETLDYSYERQIESLQDVKKGVADVVTAKKRLQMQSEGLERAVVKLDTQARQALAAGNEDHARAALERKNVAQTERSPRRRRRWRADGRRRACHAACRRQHREHARPRRRGPGARGGRDVRGPDGAGLRRG